MVLKFTKKPCSNPNLRVFKRFMNEGNYSAIQSLMVASLKITEKLDSKLLKIRSYGDFSFIFPKNIPKILSVATPKEFWLNSYE